MSHAQRCPICLGEGEIRENDVVCTMGPQLKTCHGCGGRGWITIQDPYPSPTTLTPPNWLEDKKRKTF